MKIVKARFKPTKERLLEIAEGCKEYLLDKDFDVSKIEFIEEIKEYEINID